MPLQQAGQHTILVSEFFSNGTVDYALSLQCISVGCETRISACGIPPPDAEAFSPEDPIACRGPGCRVPIVCNLLDPASMCRNRIVLFVRAPASRLNAVDLLGGEAFGKGGKRVRFASRVSNIPPGQIKPVRLRFTKAGRKIAQAGKRTIRGVIEIRNAPGELISRTRVKVLIK